MTKDTDIIKHSAAIQITNEVTLLQRRAWNALLGNAYEHLLDREKHQIALQDLADVLGFDSKNEKYLRENLKILVKTTVEWNILGKDKDSDWGISSLLSDVRVRKGVCYYSYGAFLKEMLYSPKMYAKISLSMQNKFKSKHALALYELFVDYFDVSRGKGETPFISVAKFRNMMGIKSGQYTEFKKLNKWVISDPLKEINKKSNLTVEMKYQRERRKVVAIKFLVKEKKEFISMLESGLKKARHSDPLVVALMERRVSQSNAERLVKEYDKAYIWLKIEYCDYQTNLAKGGKIPKDKVPQSGKWLIKAIEEDWQPPKGFKPRAEREKVEREKRLFGQAQKYLGQGQHKKATIVLDELDDSNLKVRALRNRVDEEVRKQELEKEIERYRKGLTDEEIESLHTAVGKQIEELEAPIRQMGLKSGKNEALYQSCFRIALEERYLAQNDQLTLTSR